MKLLDDLVHRHAVQVRRDKMQDEPISKLLHVSQPVAQDALDLAGLDRSSGVGFDEVYLNRRRTDDGQLVDETDCRDESQSDEPEPEKDVIFSLMTLRGRTHRPSMCSIVPEDPYL